MAVAKMSITTWRGDAFEIGPLPTVGSDARPSAVGSDAVAFFSFGILEMKRRSEMPTGTGKAHGRATNEGWRPSLAPWNRGGDRRSLAVHKSTGPNTSPKLDESVLDL
jgi:hypothetical protein